MKTVLRNRKGGPRQRAAAPSAAKRRAEGRATGKRGLADLDTRLVQQAMQLYHAIYPCATKQDFAECFTDDKERRLFWFNTDDQSTHVVSAQR